MVDVREAEGLGLACFATKSYELGDTIINETPLIVIERPMASQINGKVDAAGFLSKILSPLQTALEEMPEEKRKAALDLFCPMDNDLEVLERKGIHFDEVDSVDYATVMKEAEKLCPTKEEALTLVRLFCIWKYNATNYKGTTDCLSKNHARMNHSCSPNAMHHSGIIRAIKKINPGDMINISYLDHNGLQTSTHLRRKRLELCYGFICQCERCTNQIDLSRTMKCPNCRKSSVIWGLVLKECVDNKNDVAASCTQCNTSYTHAEMPTTKEAALENQVKSLRRYSSFVDPSSDFFLKHLHMLHSSVLDELGGAHWTAAALMKLRYDYDPMVNLFTVIQWGEAYANWCKLAIPDSPWMYYLYIFAIGSACCDLNSPDHIGKIGLRYLKECYENCKLLWGNEDKDVRGIEAMINYWSKKFDCKEVCTYINCERSAEVQQVTASTTKGCKACGLARYCDQKCQKGDWKDHKVVCKAARALKEFELSQERIAIY